MLFRRPAGEHPKPASCISYGWCPLVTSFQLQNEQKTKHFTQFHSTLTQVPVPFGKFQHFVQIHSNLGESTALKNKNSKSCMRKISLKKGNKVFIKKNMAER
ncbi:hypothetical protein XENORESO_021032 [Xenotaenia resolanae]|uniref:Uncharacterized protein n=1 Tax=Xenotaenia resolanae TaxID=208358 RepID=A0ABV0VVB3_9TELE